MPSDIEIAQAARMDRIMKVSASLGIPDDFVEPYGHYKAKVDQDSSLTPGKRLDGGCLQDHR